MRIAPESAASRPASRASLAMNSPSIRSRDAGSSRPASVRSQPVVLQTSSFATNSTSSAVMRRERVAWFNPALRAAASNCPLRATAKNRRHCPSSVSSRISHSCITVSEKARLCCADQPSTRGRCSEEVTDVREIGHYIGGRMVAGRSGQTQAVFDPATGSSDAMVALASSADMNEAVAAAKAAWPE
jgi:hypothetical protein